MKTTNNATKNDAYQIVTDRIIAQLSQGIIPWEKPWIGGTMETVSGQTGKPYSLLNQMLLPRPGKYFTFKQAKDLGASVRKGEKASYVVFWKQYVKEIAGEYNDDGTPKTETLPVLKWFTVFHEDQIDNLPEAKRSQPDEAPGFEVNPNKAAEAMIAGYTGHEKIALRINKGSDKACYYPAFDEINLPAREQFACTAEFYSTAFHEMTHSTGHASRLNRLTKTAHSGNKDYSKEELVAEIGSAMLMNVTGNEIPRTLKNSAAYCQSWLKVLKGDKRFIVSAASQAAKAADYIQDAAAKYEAETGTEMVPAAGTETAETKPETAAAKKPAGNELTAAEKLEKKYSKAPTKAQRIAAAKRITKACGKANFAGVQQHETYTAVMSGFHAIRFFKGSDTAESISAEIESAIPAAPFCFNLDRAFEFLPKPPRSNVEEIDLPSLADIRRYVDDSRKCKGRTTKMLADNLYCDFALLLDLLTICPSLKAYRYTDNPASPVYFIDEASGIDALLCPVRIAKAEKKAA